jgi:hypothetical protein
MPNPCDLVRERLDELLDGTLEPALQGHVTDCDVCRDLRHDLRHDAELLRDAGGDYRHPDDFESRLLAAIDARPDDAGRITLTDGSPAVAAGDASESTPGSGSGSASGSRVPVTREIPAAEGGEVAKTQAMPAHLSPEKAASASAAGAAGVTAGARASASADGAASADASTSASASIANAALGAHRSTTHASHSATKRGGRRIALPRSRAFWLTAATLTAAAAALPFAIREAGTSSSNSAHSNSPTANRAIAAREAWHGRVDAIARAAADPNGGLEIKRAGDTAFAPLAANAEIPAGAEIRTDPRTRARIELADGTRLVLDRATDVRFDGAIPRAANVVTGAIIADVSHVDGAPEARIALPTGGVTVLGTKFALTASDDRSTVRVTRGVVRMNAPNGREVEVKTGEEGVLAAGAAPEVSPAVDLAESVAWSEFGGPQPVEPDAPIVGLGELRARRPGHQDENDHQVALAAHTVRVRIVGNVARTEIDETFRNDTANELEGIYRFPLPPEAQIEKLSLDVHGRMEDGAFVDRQRAAAIWRGVIRNAVHPIQQAQQTDELVWVPGPWRDPALLEWQRGGRFELRIFPIPAHGQRRVTIAYTQTIAPSGALRRYVYPLAHDANGSTRVEQFDVDVQVLGNDPALGVRARGYALANDGNATVPGATHMSFSQSSFVPAGDLVLEYGLPDHQAPVTTWAFQPPSHDPTGVGATAPATTPTPARANGHAPPPAPVAPSTSEPAFVAMALRPTLPHWTESRPRDYAIVVDTSRSMVGERLARAVRLTRALVAEMDPRDRLAVLACDTTCREMPGGLQYAGAPAVHAVEEFLGSVEAAGGSDLVAQMRAAIALVGRAPDRDGRVVYLGDGTATVGYRRTDLVATEVAESLPSGRTTITTVALGHDADTATLAAIARAGGGVAVPYAPGESVQTAAISALEATYGVALRDPVLTLPAGLTEITPSRLGTVRAGGEILVAARMSGSDASGDAVLRGTVAGEPFEQRFPIRVHATSDVGNSFVPRLFASQRIADLESTDAIGARDEIVNLSQRFHVPSRFTSLLVLESDAMYRAFGVRREAQNEVSWTGEQSAVASVTPAQSEPSMAEREADRAAADDLAADPNLANGRFSGGLIGAGEAAQTEPPAETAGTAVVGGLGVTGTAVGGGGGGLVTGTGNGYGIGAGRTGMIASRSTRASAAASDDDESEPSLGDNAAPATAAATTPTMPVAQQPAPTPARMAGVHAQLVAATPAAPPAVSSGGASASSASGARAPSMGHAAAGPMASMAAPTADRTRRRAFMPLEDPNVVTQRPVPPGAFVQGGQWMRRTWVRRASTSPDANARSSDLDHVAVARAALQALPDSKTRHQELYRWLSVSANFDEAADIANRWSTRDALDPDALTRLADVAARRGERERAIRILGGVIDVRPDDVNALKRMIALHDRAGESSQACAYRISLAQVQSFDANAVADAVRCERALAHPSSAARLLASVIDASVRTRAENAANTAAPAVANSARGEIVLDANWDTPADLDLALIDNQGRRLSWLGGRNTGITVRGARDARSEALGLARASVGDYAVEISRAQVENTDVTGRIVVTVLGEHRTLAFHFRPGEKTVRAGRISVTREEQLVPVAQF